MAISRAPLKISKQTAAGQWPIDRLLDDRINENGEVIIRNFSVQFHFILAASAGAHLEWCAFCFYPRKYTYLFTSFFTQKEFLTSWSNSWEKNVNSSAVLSYYLKRRGEQPTEPLPLINELQQQQQQPDDDVIMPEVSILEANNDDFDPLLKQLYFDFS